MREKSTGRGAPAYQGSDNRCMALLIYLIFSFILSIMQKIFDQHCTPDRQPALLPLFVVERSQTILYEMTLSVSDAGDLSNSTFRRSLDGYDWLNDTELAPLDMVRGAMGKTKLGWRGITGGGAFVVSGLLNAEKPDWELECGGGWLKTG